MLRRLHDRLGTAGFVISIVALIAAVGGTAYAAGGLTKSQEKQVTKIAKKYAGKPGAAGTNGANGSPGAKGDAGAAGSNGTNGTNATTVSFSGNAHGCTGGGVEVKSAGAPTYVCNGTFSTEPLPSGQTLTGAWATSENEALRSVTLELEKEEVEGKQVVTEARVIPQKAELLQIAAISFPIQVSPAPTTLVQVAEGASVGILVETEAASVYAPTGNPQEDWAKACPGTVEEPKAAAGFLCVYAGGGTGAGGTLAGAPSSFIEAAHPYGVDLPFKASAGSVIPHGSWAVTAE